MEHEQVTLTVDRNSPDDMQERELYVSVDGGPNAILRYPDSVTVPVSPGHHRLRVHNTISRKHAEFDAVAGDRIRFRAANVRGKHFAMLAMFFGIGPMYTVLERVAEAQDAVQEPGAAS